MKTAPALAFVASLLVACSAAQPSPTIEGGASGAAPTSSPVPTATQRPTAAPTESPAPTDTSFEWGEPAEMTGFDGGWPDAPLLAYANGTYVLVNSPQVLTSADTTAWSRADLPFAEEHLIELHGIVAGGPGFIIVGTETIEGEGDAYGSAGIVLISSDGRRWERLEDSRFANSAIHHIGRSRQGLVAFGNTRDAAASIWTSVDGMTWLKATNDTGVEVARGVQLVAEHAGVLTAFVRRAGGNPDELGPVDVWQTEGRAEWQKVGALPDSNASVHRAAFGGGRWLAVGFAPGDDSDDGPDAWSSPDGRTWTRTAAPVEAHAAIAGWKDGLIVASHTGSSPGETCGGSEPYVGRSRVSLSGGEWIVVRPTEASAATALLVVGDQILAIGLSTRSGERTIPVRWLVPLPRAVAAPAPTPTPAPTPPSEGCGG